MKHNHILLHVMITLICSLLLVDAKSAAALHSTEAEDHYPRGSILAESTSSEALVATAVAVQGNYAYLAFGTDLIVLNVSNPAYPVRVTSRVTGGTANAVVIEATRLYVSGPDMGVTIYDISSPTNPQYIGSYNPSGIENDIDADGLTLFVADPTNGLRIVDVSNAGSPALLSTTNYPWGGAYAVAVSGNYAYVSHWPVLAAIDITNKTSPNPRGVMEYCSPCGDMAISGTRLISIRNASGGLPSGAGDLFIADVSDPNGGVSLGSLSIAGRFQDVEVDSNYAYIADLDSGLIIVNIGTPSNPQIIARYDTLGTSRDVAIAGLFAYIADEDAGLRILDISNSATIREVGHYHPAEDGSLGECTPNRSAACVWLTTANGNSKLATSPAAAFQPDNTSTLPTIDVDEATQYQPIDGFGASLTDSAAYLLWKRLPESQRIDTLAKLFDPVNGIGLSVIRLPMGASDFARESYTYDDNGGVPDESLQNFSVGHDEDYIIPVLKNALQLNPSLKIIAVPWSAPAWMKTTGSLNGGRLKLEYYDAYAQYFVKFINAYEAYDLPIYAISIQNEPANDTTSYPSMTFSDEEADYFIRMYLGPALRRNGLSTKILAWDHNWDDLTQADAILGNSRTSGYVTGTAFHCYEGNYIAQSALVQKYPNSEIHLTECSGRVIDPFDDSLEWITENLMIGAVQNWSRSVLRWNLALDQYSGPKNGGCDVCRGVVTIADDASIPPSTKTITFEVDYYALGHASKFVKEGAVHIESTEVAGNVRSIAFQNSDRTIALVVLNDTDASSTFKVRSNDRMFTYTLSGKAVATFVWPGASTPVPTFTIDGIALDTDGNPITGAEFKISRHLGYAKSLLGSVNSDSAGHFQVEYLNAGTYLLEASSAGYQWLPEERIISIPPSTSIITFTAATRGTSGTFVPSVHGYSFANGSRTTNWDIFRDTFGADMVEFSVAGMPTPRPVAKLYYEANYKCSLVIPNCTEVGMGGNCSGIGASTTLFLKNWEVPTLFLASQSVSNAYSLPTPPMVNGLWQATPVTDLILKYQGYQFGRQISEANAAALAAPLQQDVSTIKAAVDQNLDNPIQIGLIDTYNGKCVGHALVPYGYTNYGDEFLVHVYDSNYPGDATRTIVINTKQNTWQYQILNNVLWSSVGNGCPGGTFSVLPTSLWRTSPLPPWSTGISTMMDASSLNAAFYEVVSTSGKMLLEDVDGHKLGWDNDAYVEEISGAYEVIPLSLISGTVPNYSSRFIFTESAPMTIHLPEGEQSTIDVSVFSPASAISYSRHSLANTSTSASNTGADLVTVGDNLESVSIQTSSPGNQELTLIEISPSTERFVTIEELETQANAKTSLSTSTGWSTFVLTTPLSAKSYVLTIESVGETNVSFSAPISVTVPGEVHMVGFDWSKPETVQLGIDQNSDGIPEEVKTVKDADLPSGTLYLPSVSK